MKKAIIFLFFLVMLSSFAFAQTLNDAELAYSFDNADLSGSNPLDISGNAHTGTNSGATTGVTGILLQGFEFDSTDYVDTGYNGVDTSQSIFIWFYPNTTSDYGTLFANNDATFNNYFKINLAHDTNQIRYISDNSALLVDKTLFTYSANNWHFAGITFDDAANNVCFYYGNQTAGVLNSRCYTQTGSDFTTQSYYIGRNRQNTANTFDGGLDMFMYYTKALSNSTGTGEVEALFNGGNGFNPYSASPSPAANLFDIYPNNADASIDMYEFTTQVTVNNTNVSAKTTNITITWNETYDQSGTNKSHLIVNNAVYSAGKFLFNGVNTSLEFPNAPNLQNDFTVCYEAKSTTATWNGNRNIFAKRDQILLGGISGGTTFELGLWQTGFTSITTTASNIQQFNTYCGVVNGTNASIWINGEYKTSATIGSMNSDTGSIFLGRDDGVSDFFNGEINWLKIWVVPLNDAEINAENGTEVISRWQNLTAYYPFQQIDNTTKVNLTVTKENQPFSITSFNYDTVDDYIFNFTVLNVAVYDILSNDSLSPYNADINGYDMFSLTNTTDIFLPQNETINFTTSYSGYFDKSTVFNTTGFTDFFRSYMRPFGSIDVYVYDINTSALMNQTVTLLVQNDTNQVTYSVINGEGAVVGLQGGETYTFQLYSAGYATNTFTLTYNNESSINFYMQKGQTDITFNVQDTATNSIENAKLSIEAFVGGVYVTISEGFSDVVGEYIANLQTGVTHRITVSKDGFVSKTFTTQLLSTSYTVILDRATIFDVTQGQDVITTKYAPTSTNLTPSVQFFYANITSTGGNIEYAYIKLWYNGTLLTSDNLTANGGGQLSFSYNITAFNQTGLPLLFEYGYKLSNSTSITRLFHAYTVTSSDTYTGSLLELRNRLSTKLSLSEKVGLYAITLIILMILISVFVQGLVNVVISTGLALIAGWVFGLNLIILGLIFFISIIVLIAFSERGGGI